MADGEAGNVSILTRLADGRDVSDDDVDSFYPRWIRQLSRMHWTPVEVAQTAARFLVEGHPQPHILDVGSGVGKFCVVGAATTGARFTGVERRPALTEIAEDFARRLNARTAQFTLARMEDLNWTRFTGIYFYNPFGENFIKGPGSIDEIEPKSWPIYLHAVRTAIARLYLMPVGTRVATYHGLGAPLPPGYDLVGSQVFTSGILRFYVRADPLRPALPPDESLDAVDALIESLTTAEDPSIADFS
ncbi:MAG: class I SAM-dependent methyltransferase [Deltaproteobacteria bacterium]|nr:class I SAM-dependent methyltransferase [Deltaproteobacteria bacterium]